MTCKTSAFNLKDWVVFGGRIAVTNLITHRRTPLTLAVPGTLVLLTNVALYVKINSMV